MKRPTAVFLAVCMLLAFCSCTRSGLQKYSRTSYEYLDTVCTVVAYEDRREDFDRAAEGVFSILEALHREFDIYHEYSGINNLCTVNRMAGQTVEVSQSIIDLLEYCHGIYVLTSGRTNVAMGSVLSVWHTYREQGNRDPENAELPPMTQLLQAAEHCDINDVETDRAAGTVRLADPGMSIDVGAVAKGYVAEKCAEYLAENGYDHYALNFGGNIRLVGSRGDGDWTVGIEDPQSIYSSEYACTVSVSGRSLVTSGSYQRYYTVDGTRYHHLISPDSLMPENRYLSVSVLTENSALADALSTALFVSDPEWGMQLIESLANTEAYFIMPDGTVRHSSGWVSKS